MSQNTLYPAHGETREYLYNRIGFWLNGQYLEDDIPPAMTVMDYLHQVANLWGTKCSCNEGDCGACTVAIAYPKEGNIVYEAVNSCLYTAAKLHGKHLITVEGLGSPDALHPIQSALLDWHGSQCGYCTPGFVMSLFALLASVLRPGEEDILAALEGNLCRCTGYDSILKAARHLSEHFTPEQILPPWCRGIESLLFNYKIEPAMLSISSGRVWPSRQYHTPRALDQLWPLMAQNPDYIIIRGGTDIMVQMNIQRKEFATLLDLSMIPELDKISYTPQGIVIGANVTYSDIMASGVVKADLPCLSEIIRLIASRQIRNFGTLIGNIANASPIGDSIPLLLALESVLVLSSSEGDKELPLSEFFLSYRHTALQPGEIIRAIRVPIPAKTAFIRVKKAAKRKAVDISSVASALRIETQDGIVKQAFLAVGGMDAIPRLSVRFHNALSNMELQGLHAAEIAAWVAEEFQPLTDVRGSAEYRSKALQMQVLEYLNEFLGGRRS